MDITSDQAAFFLLFDLFVGSSLLYFPLVGI